MKFQTPYFVTMHAVNQFRQRVYNLPTRLIREIIQEQLQTATPYYYQWYNNEVGRIFKQHYNNITYYVPVSNDHKEQSPWEIVTTILLPHEHTFNGRNAKQIIKRLLKNGRK